MWSQQIWVAGFFFLISGSISLHSEHFKRTIWPLFHLQKKLRKSAFNKCFSTFSTLTRISHFALQGCFTRTEQNNNCNLLMFESKVLLILSVEGECLIKDWKLQFCRRKHKISLIFFFYPTLQWDYSYSSEQSLKVIKRLNFTSFLIVLSKIVFLVITHIKILLKFSECRNSKDFLSSSDPHIQVR